MQPPKQRKPHTVPFEQTKEPHVQRSEKYYMPLRQRQKIQTLLPAKFYACYPTKKSGGALAANANANANEDRYCAF
jgi:hypothetical protein